MIRSAWPSAFILIWSILLVLGSQSLLAKDYHWLQRSAQGLELRAITANSSCPTLEKDGRSVPMQQRMAPGPGFGVRSCFARIEESDRQIKFEGSEIARPKAQPDTILLIGDTGCRIHFPLVQACNDDQEWPFRRIADSAARLKPDLILHVGDFYYREQACPLADHGCKGSVHGDNWPTWETDFFAPAQNLLTTAPWIMVRGNHEECERGGRGWSLFLDPIAEVSNTDCLRLHEPYRIDLGGISLIVIDSSNASEWRENASQAEIYRKQFAAIDQLAPAGPVWIAMHRPIWAAAAKLLGKALGGNATLAAAAPNLPARTQLILSGHVHTFQILDFEENLPIQLITGHSGDQLHRTASDSPAGLTLQGAKVRSGRGQSGQFGFALLSRMSNGQWKLSNHDLKGEILSTCTFVGKRLDCR